MDNFKWVALGGVAVGLPRIARKGLAALRHLTFDINILMTIAVVGESRRLLNLSPCEPCA